MQMTIRFINGTLIANISLSLSHMKLSTARMRAIQNWMTCFFLKLNPQKTEIMLLGNKSVLTQIAIRGVNLPDGHTIRFVSVSKNLGVFIDQILAFTSPSKLHYF